MRNAVLYVIIKPIGVINAGLHLKHILNCLLFPVFVAVLCVFGKVFWDYSWIPFNLGGRINLLYCFFWGIASVVWMKYLYPKISALIERVPAKIGKKLTYIMLLFMLCNILVSSMALIRSTERANNIPATATWQQIMDERFDDDRLLRIYPNAIQTN